MLIRKIPFNYPKLIYESPEQKFFDNSEGTKIAVKRLKYNSIAQDINISPSLLCPANIAQAKMRKN